MKNETKIILALLIISPMIAELLSGSTPPLNYFNPFVILIMTLTYGCLALLIREIKARKKMQWSFIFLLPLMGIFIEGIFMQSFFNKDHMDLGVLAEFGTLFGVRWPWAIELTIFHAVIPLLIPIVIVDMLWPKHVHIPVLKRWGIIINIVLVTLASVFYLFVVVYQKSEAMYDNYNMQLLPNLVLLVISGLLIYLGIKFSKNRVNTDGFIIPPWMMGMFGFIAMGINVIVPHAMAQSGATGLSTVITQLVFVALLIAFAFFQILNKKNTSKHITALVLGSVMAFSVFAVFQSIGWIENIDGTKGMMIVGIVSFILLLLWRYRINSSSKQK